MIFIAVLLFCMLFVIACEDYRSRTIPNEYVLVVLLLSVLYVSVRVSAYGEIIDHALAFICTVGAGFILFALRIWGGGDSKLLMALAPITQPETLLLLIFLVVICGFFQAIGIIAYRCLRPHPDYRNEMPYGIAIACGAIIYLVLDTMVGMVELETIL